MACVRSGKYQYWWCQSCETAQVIPQPTLAELDEFYRTFHLSDQEGGRYDQIEDRMQADFPVKARLARDVSPQPDARLVDVGCGKGYFIREANRVGFRAVGIDLSTTGVTHAREQLGVDATAGLIETDAPDEWRNAFDVATFWATIEHVPDPRRTLAAIYRCLKPGGYVLLDTGFAGPKAERILPGHSQWYDAPQHLWVFGEGGLTNILRNAGFDVIRVDRNFERSPLRRVVRWIRHTAICLSAYAATRMLLGTTGFQACRRSTKWPIGRLISVIARKPTP